jgi:hypothetical protein
MVQKNAFAAAICTGFLVLAGPAPAAEYRAGELLGMDLSKSALSPKRLGPEAQFAPVRIEAKTDHAQIDADTSVWPKLRPRKQVSRTVAEPVRAKLAKRPGNPLDAQARDTRIQTWPCKSGGICAWQR